MSYMALYRKFRPLSFDQVKGQDHVVRTLKNQVKTGRIGHAYLFTGTRGTGKTTVAKIFARAINCMDPHDGEPCGECEICRDAISSSFMDITEIDAASNTGVDDIRRIIEEVRYTPVKGRYKVYIIDEAHMLSGAAFNAFLKTLEEPPSYVVFILATTEPHKLPITILSRCQRYDFHRIGNDDIVSNLSQIAAKEGVECEEKALRYIARMGDGSMRDSVSILDKCIAFNLGRSLTYDNVLSTLGAADTDVFSRTFRAVYASDAHAAISELESAISEGKDINQYVTDLIWYMRNLLMLNAAGADASELLGIADDDLEQMKKDARSAQPEILMRYIRILSSLLSDIRFSPSGRILTEVALIKLAKPQMETDILSLVDRVRQLEERSCSTGAGRPADADIHIYDTRTHKDEAAPPYHDMQEAGEMQMQSMPVDNRELKPENNMPSYAALPSKSISPKETPDHDTAAKIVCRSWDDIISACPPRLKVALKKSKPWGEDENGVMIYAPEGVISDTVKGSLKELEAIINKITGVSKMLSVSSDILPDEKRGKKSSENIDELLKNINFNIETEEA